MIADLAMADLTILVAKFGPQIGPWYADLGRGHGSAVVDDTPWWRGGTIPAGNHRSGPPPVPAAGIGASAGTGDRPWLSCIQGVS